MKAVACTRYGPLAVLRWTDVETPVPGDHEVLVKVHAVSLNVSDWEVLRGKPLYPRIGGPFWPRHHILGSDIAGRIEAAGRRATLFRPGEEVFAGILSHMGGFGEYVCVPQTALARMPAGMTYEQAAALPQAGAIAAQGIRDKRQVRPGHKVLVNGVGGGSGMDAVQLNKLGGAEVTGVDNTEKLRFMRSLGANHVIDYAREGFTRNGRSYDLILDLAAHRPALACNGLAEARWTIYVVGGSVATLLQVLLIGPLIGRAEGKKIRLLVVRLGVQHLAPIVELCQPGAHPRIVVPAAPGGVDVRAENALPGYPGWRISSPGRPHEIEGYTGHASARPGTVVRLFVSTTAAWFRVRALRFGWYGGTLARLVWTSAPVRGTRQPAAVVQAHGMVVAPWRPSLALPTAGWPPGSYLLRLDASSGAQQYVPLVIRSPSAAGRVVLVQPTATYQASNLWGGYDLYQGPRHHEALRARIVSFDRPYDREGGAADFFAEEQPLLSDAERLGLPLACISSADLDLDPHVLDGARAVVSEAHDEYWSPQMRVTLTRARDRGTNLAFIGANEIYRRIRLGPSPLGPDRIEINYRNPREDPLDGTDNALVTANWPDPPAADPPSSLTGQAYACAAAPAPLVVTDPSGWIWAGTGARPGLRLPGLIGHEFDTVDLSRPTPRPIQILARSPQACAGSGRAVWADVTSYVAASGAGVLNVGTQGWSCGLPATAMVTDRCPATSPPAAVVRVIERATRNILQAFARGPAGRVHPARDFLTGQVSH